MCQTIETLIKSDVLTTISICCPGGSRYQPGSEGGGGAGGGGVTRDGADPFTGELSIVRG